ncbi:MAG TPA: hypothetical protein VFJ93_13360 [Gaiellaceae bacterium]|nr:hypothetical protein [Gaiellaceae bacterium]
MLRAPRALGATLAHESLAVVVYSGVVLLLAVLVPEQLSSDGWLALVGGRVIAHHGVPHHDTLAALTSGRDWIDQQWLGQLGTYGIDWAGGIRLLLAVNVVLVSGAFVAAGVYARRHGARPGTLALVVLAAMIPFLVTAMNVRTQSFVYLPFVGLIALLVRDRPMSGRSTAAALVVLVLWANVHGSALLAAGLIASRGAVDLWRTRRDPTAWVLLLAPWPCLLVSPYHVHLVSYYHRTAFNSSFATYLSQWAPTTFSPISAPLLLLAFMTVWMLGRSAASYTLYERLLLGVAVLLALLAVRNWTFACLLLVMLSPQGFDRALRRKAARPAPALGAVVATVAALAALVSIVGALSTPHVKLTRNYSSGVARAAAEAASRPGAQVYAGIAYADWLLWLHPELAGKVVFDVRYELLHAPEVKRLVLFDAGSQTDAPLGRPVAFVLDPDVEKDALTGIRPDVRTVYKTDHAVVAVARNGQ